MNKVIALLATLTAIMLGGCAEEELVCMQLDEVRVCRPASEVQPCGCADAALIYGDVGLITLSGVSDHPYDALDQMVLIIEALNGESVVGEEYLDGPTWSYQLFLNDHETQPYYTFYGQRVIAVWDENGDHDSMRYVTFWGIWTDADSDIMRPRLEAFAESIELLD